MATELPKSDKNLAANLAGISCTILTFLIFFLYDRAKTGEIDMILFQIMIASVVLSMFAFGFSAFYYDRVVLDMLSSDKGRLEVDFRAAILFFLSGLLLLLLEPVLITYSIRLTIVALMGSVLWIAFVLLTMNSYFKGRKERAAYTGV